jgi:hypothetical protein
VINTIQKSEQRYNAIQKWYHTHFLAGLFGEYLPSLPPPPSLFQTVIIIMQGAISQYSSRHRLDAKFRWLTPKHLKQHNNKPERC